MPAKIENYLYALGAIHEMRIERVLPSESVAVENAIEKLVEAISEQESDVLIVVEILQQLQRELIKSEQNNDELKKKLLFLINAIQFTIYTSLQYPVRQIHDKIISDTGKLRDPKEVASLMKEIQRDRARMAKEGCIAKKRQVTKQGLMNECVEIRRELAAIIEHNGHSKEVVAMAMVGQETVTDAQNFYKNNRICPIAVLLVPQATLKLVKAPTKGKIKAYEKLSQEIKRKECAFQLSASMLILIGAAEIVAGFAMALTGAGLVFGIGLGLVALGGATMIAGAAVGADKSSNLPSNTSETVNKAKQNGNQYVFYNQQRQDFNRKIIKASENASAFSLIFPRRCSSAI